MAELDPEILAHLDSLVGEGRRCFACPGRALEEVKAWQEHARPAFRKLIGLAAIAESTDGFEPVVQLDPAEDFGDYTLRGGSIRTEPHVTIPFWLLRPAGPGPFPLGVFPHGHQNRGMDSYVGIADSESALGRIETEERDVAVQAVRQGFVAIAPTTRGFEPAGIADLTDRHDGRGCRCSAMHSLLAGRTLTGERVWDLQRLLDWACTLEEVDAGRVLMMGNSGGGVVTVNAAACDVRIKAAVASCSFCTHLGRGGQIHICDCHVVPGLMTFGEVWDVAALILPRALLVVHGRTDPLFPREEIERAVSGIRWIYDTASLPDRFAHRWGEGGHRFYKDLMWPFVRRSLGMGA